MQQLSNNKVCRDFFYYEILDVLKIKNRETEIFVAEAVVSGLN